MNKPSPQARNKIGALQSLYDVASPAALLIIALFVFLITPPAQAQDYTSNLMAHWTLDETAGNTIADETSNNNDGVWSDGTGDDVTEESTAGVIGNALTFDGTNDRIFIGNHTGLSFAAGEDFSVAAWVKLDNCQSSGSKIIENKSSSYYNLQCYASENQMRFQVRDSNSVQAWALATSTTINDSQWHHVVGVKNGHDLHIYIDGVLEGTNDTKTFNGSVGGNDVRIGYSVDGGSRNVDGTLDEVRVYNRALTAADITALYNLSASTPALTGHWTLDDAAGAVATDDSDTGNNGALENAPTWVEGNLSGAVEFTEASDRIKIPSNAAYNISTGGGYSAFFWFRKTTDCGPNNEVMLSRFGLNHGDRTWWIGCSTDDKLRLVLHGDTAELDLLGAPTVIDDGQWHHAGWVYDGAAGQTRLYLDGNLEDSINGTLDVDVDIANPICVASYNATCSDGQYYFDGTLDDIRLYNYALTDAEIGTLYNSGSQKLVAHWKLDETTGNTIIDSSGNGNTGTWSDGDDNDVTGESGAGIIDNALTFDGSNDQIFVGNHSGLKFSVDQNFTVAAWVNLNNCQSSGSKFVESKTGTSFYNLQCYASENQVRFQVRDNNAEMGYALGTTLVNDSQWHHVVGVKNGNDLHIYVDGVLEGTDDTKTFATSIGGDDVRIGYSVDGGSRNVDGKLDDIRIYNYALSDAQITALYNDTSGEGAGSCNTPNAIEGTLRYNTDQHVMQYCNGSTWLTIGRQDTSSGSGVNLVGHWKLDETTGNTITDSSGNGNTGTWSDGDDNDVTGETGAGAIDNALTFDGTNDYILISDSPNIGFTNADNFTFAAWVKLNSCQSSGSKIIEIKSVSSGEDTITLQCYSSTNLTFFGMRDNNSVSNDLEGTTPINDGAWHHVVGVKNGNTLSVYVDGVLENSDNSVNYTGDFPANDLRIGWSINGGARKVDGTLDDI
ncbi:MAG: LamG domain-containing protein, partial [Alphaproteobacteria bacterium]